MKAKRDDTYFFDRLITFQVEDTIFHVPRGEFEDESEVFADMFALPSDAATEDGRDEEHPLRLEGITASELRSFLKALFPRRGLSSAKNCTDEELDAALRLARMWCFKDFERVLVQDLESCGLPSARKLELARTHDIRKWYKPELRLLAQRSFSLTPGEVTQLGPTLTSILSVLWNERYTTFLHCSLDSRSKLSGWISVSEIESRHQESIWQRVERKLSEFSRQHHWDD